MFSLCEFKQTASFLCQGLIHRTPTQTLKRKCCKLDDIFITGCTRSCQNDSLTTSCIARDDNFAKSAFPVQWMCVNKFKTFRCVMSQCGLANPYAFLLWHVIEDYNITRPHDSNTKTVPYIRRIRPNMNCYRQVSMMDAGVLAPHWNGAKPLRTTMLTRFIRVPENDRNHVMRVCRVTVITHDELHYSYQD